MTEDEEAVILKLIDKLPSIADGLTHQRLSIIINRMERTLEKKRVPLSDITSTLAEQWMSDATKAERCWGTCSTNLVAPPCKVNGGKITNWQLHVQHSVSRIDHACFNKLDVLVWPLQIVSGNRLDDPRNGPLYDGEFFYTTVLCVEDFSSGHVETLNTFYELIGERGSGKALSGMSAEKARKYYHEHAEPARDGYLY